MPIFIDDAPTLVAGGRSVRIPGLPDFNAGDPAFKINAFDGWFDTPVPTAVMVANGGGPGVVATGDWDSAEAYYNLTGRIDLGANREGLATFARLLRAALPADREVPLVCLGNGLDVDLQVFVRRYDKATMQLGQRLDFSIPLVAPDPYKYALEPVAGDVGVFTGQRWYRTYEDDGSGNWVRTYTSGNRSYEQSIPSGPYPQSLTLFSDGDASSQRLVATINGELSVGDWWLLNEATGRRLWAELSMVDGQELVFDMQAKTAFLNGSDVGHTVYGDWLTLEPGPNTYRLVSGTDTGAFAHFDALPANQ